MYLRNNVLLTNLEKFYFEDVTILAIIDLNNKDFRKSAILMPKVNFLKFRCILNRNCKHKSCR